MSVRRRGVRREPVFAVRESAATALGALEPGLALSMMTRGQFSLLDLIRAILDQVGPSDLVLSTWTMGMAEAAELGGMLRTGRLRSVRVLIDRSLVSRIGGPRFGSMRRELGEESFVLSRVHAKFAVLLGGALPVVVRTSMNLNRNRRWEQADIDVDADLCAFFAGFVEQLGGRLPSGLDASPEAIAAAMGGDWPSRLRGVVARREVDDLLAELDS